MEVLKFSNVPKQWGKNQKHVLEPVSVLWGNLISVQTWNFLAELTHLKWLNEGTLLRGLLGCELSFFKDETGFAFLYI